MNEKLLPCPCCGGPAEFDRITDQTSPNFGGEFINCTRCPITTDLRFSLGESAWEALIEDWNRRAAPSPMVVPDSDLAAFAETVSEFEACNETATPYDTLMRWAAMGWLECTYFDVTQEGRAMLASAPKPEGGE